MPTYEYECKNEECKHRFEKKQAYGEEPVTTCPKCGGEMRKIIFAIPSIFPGGKPSNETRTHKVGDHEIPVHQTKEGHWEQGGLRGKG